MEIICNCILVSYVKNATGYVNSGGYFASNNDYNNHLRIKLNIINKENESMYKTHQEH